MRFAEPVSVVVVDVGLVDGDAGWVAKISYIVQPPQPKNLKMSKPAETRGFCQVRTFWLYITFLSVLMVSIALYGFIFP